MTEKDINKSIEIFKEFNKFKEKITDKTVSQEMAQFIKMMIHQTLTINDVTLLMYYFPASPFMDNTVNAWDGQFHNPIKENGIEYPINFGNDGNNEKGDDING